MLIHVLSDSDGSRCQLTYDEPDRWLRATWRGYVDPLEALRGAEMYLVNAAPFHCAYLLNDNTALEGPWFDSLDWLLHAWLPHAQRLGLRYVAHVVQADTGTDVLCRTFPVPLPGGLELQLFRSVGAAKHWLRACQDAALRAEATVPTPSIREEASRQAE